MGLYEVRITYLVEADCIEDCFERMELIDETITDSDTVLRHDMTIQA